MRNWRVLTAITAVVLAALAAGLAYRYLTEADERAQEDVELIDVLVAKNDIPRGTSGREAIDTDLFETREVPRNAIPESSRAGTEGMETLVAAAKISAGQFIVADSFVEPSRLEGFSSTIRREKMAISVTVDAMRGIAGFVVPNDTVNILVTTDFEELAVPATVPGVEVAPQPALTTSAYLIPGVKVLAIDSTTVTSPAAAPVTGDGTTGATVPAGPAASSTITLEVTARQALQITHAMQGMGQIYLTLNPPGFKAESFTVPVEIVEAVNWFDQELTMVAQVRETIRTAAGLPPG